MSESLRRVDGYLSRRVQQIWPGALVYEEADGAWILERPDMETLGLGDDFARARQAVDAILRAERGREL